MGFDAGNPSRDRAISLHRALRRALAGDVGRLLTPKQWHGIVARCTPATTKQSAINYADAMQALGLVERIEGHGVRCLDVDTDQVVMVLE